MYCIWALKRPETTASINNYPLTFVQEDYLVQSSQVVLGRCEHSTHSTSARYVERRELTSSMIYAPLYL
jgi:hypothetical protein